MALYKEVFASFSSHPSGSIRLGDLNNALVECSSRLSAAKGPSWSIAGLLDFTAKYVSRVNSRLTVWRDPGNKAPLERPHLILLSFVGSFSGILILSYIDRVMVVDKSDLVMIVGECCHAYYRLRLRC